MDKDIRLVFKFKMSVQHYRKMMESKTFGNFVPLRILLVLAWILFTVLFVLDVSGRIELTQVVHVCALLVMVAIPAAWLTMEINIFKYSNAYREGFMAERQIAVDKEGFTFTNVTDHMSGNNSWDEISKIEELKDVFLIQINKKEQVILPKKSMGDNRKIGIFKEMVNENIPTHFYPMKNRNK
ncbi:MAG: YcxB family protein [Lachnospiraceae bacterium]|nr:YcxB family protein [Lachnospiraceae bacterium]